MAGHFKADDNGKVKQIKAPAEQTAGSSKGKASATAQLKGKALEDAGATAPVTPVPPLKNAGSKTGAAEQPKVGDDIPNKTIPLNPEEPGKTVVIGGGLEPK